MRPAQCSRQATHGCIILYKSLLLKPKPFIFSKFKANYITAWGFVKQLKGINLEIMPIWSYNGKNCWLFT